MKRLALPSLPALAWHGAQPGFELTYICDGADFKTFVRARNQQAAAHEGLIELAHQCPGFDPDRARLVRAIQTQ